MVRLICSLVAVGVLLAAPTQAQNAAPQAALRPPRSLS